MNVSVTSKRIGLSIAVVGFWVGLCLVFEQWVTQSPGLNGSTRAAAQGNPGQVIGTSGIQLSEQPDALAQPDTASLPVWLDEPSGHVANDDYPTLQHRIMEMRNRRNGQPVDADAVATVLQEPEAWQPLAQLSDQFPLSEQQRHDGREFIRINQLKIESLVPGDTLELRIHQTNQHFTARIDQVSAGIDNTLNWVGTLQNNGVDVGPGAQVYFTKAGDLLIGGITTLHGHFELEARGSEGWIAQSATLFKHSDEVTVVSEDLLAQSPAVSSEALDQDASEIILTPFSPSH